MSCFPFKQFRRIRDLLRRRGGEAATSFRAQEAEEVPTAMREDRLPSTEILPQLSESNDSLSSLLEDDIILRKVLGYLIDDGLPQCRRVCRKWRRVCNQLPVKLHRVCYRDLEEIRERFPQASSVALYHEFGMLELNRVASLLEISQETIERLGTFQFLTQFNATALVWWTHTTLCATSFAPLSGLVSLNLKCSFEKPAFDICNSLRHLVHLTCLKLKGRVFSTDQIEPFTELMHIRELRVHDLLFRSSDGAQLFPSLTKLTRLEPISYKSTATQPTLEAASFHATSIVALCLTLPRDDFGRGVIDWSVLNTFTALESLEWKNATESETEFFEVLECLTGLTKLCLGGSKLNIPYQSAPAKAIFSLKALRCIEIVNYQGKETYREPYPFSNLLQLTKLVAMGFPFKDSLSTLTNLVHLQTGRCRESTSSLCQSLVHLSKLEALRLDWVQKGVVPENIFSNLTNLSTLFVGFYRVPDKIFLPSLTSLPKLKSLSLLYYPRDDGVDVAASLVNISELSCLTRLGLFFESEWNALDVFPERSFPRLQRLEYLFTKHPNHVEELKLRFSSVVQIHSSTVAGPKSLAA